MESTPRNSDYESEDDLPAISMTQTPVKSYSSCELANASCILRNDVSCVVKSIEDGELVWVKHSRDPFWPALVSQLPVFLVTD